MSNEIDLYNDLETIEDNIKNSKTKKEKQFWKKEYKKVVAEIKELYPDLAWKNKKRRR